MRIGIIGAGNLGTAIAADLGRENVIRIYSSRADAFGNTLTYIDNETGDKWNSSVECVSNSLSEVLIGVEIIFVCVPTFMISSVVDSLIQHISPDIMVGFVPGAGGVEFVSKELIKNGNIIFGFERVPYVARLESYGSVVKASKKSHYRISVLPNSKAPEICSIIQGLFDVPCDLMSEFISMTLTPSLHASRLYDLYHDYKKGDEFRSSAPWVDRMTPKVH